MLLTTVDDLAAAEVLASSFVDVEVHLFGPPVDELTADTGQRANLGCAVDDVERTVVAGTAATDCRCRLGPDFFIAYGNYSKHSAAYL